MMRRGRAKRTRREPEADPYISLPTTDPHADSYTRSHTSFHPSDSYRSAPSSSRMPYQPERDIPAHTRPEDAWSRPELDHERYTYSDLYARGERRDYDDINTRERDGWRTALDAPSYSQERGGWGRYDSDGGWDVYDTPAHGAYTDPWRGRDSREMPREDWGQDSVRNDQRGDGRRQDWRQPTSQTPAPRRDKTTNHKFASDSGWDGRRQEKYWDRDNNTRRQDSHYDKKTYGPAAEDRQWEPAPTWKGSSATTKDHSQQPQQRHRQNQYYNQSRGKRPQQQNKQRREWRNDDGDLNNWKRRDTAAAAGKGKAPQSQHSKRKHGHSRSPSRSRSRSPADSYRSYHSARSRSRSFSPASKRRRRDSSTLRSRTPSDKEPHHPHTRGAGHHSRSPSPTYRSSRSPEPRRRSASPNSSASSDRSPSRSPGPSRLHRLPHSHVESAQSKESVSPELKQTNDSQNGWHPPSEEHSIPGERTSGPPSVGSPTSAPAIRSGPETISIQMPPPAIIPAKAKNWQGPAKSWEAGTESGSSPMATSPNARGVATKNHRNPTASVKRFFPGDEEDMEVSPEDTPRVHPVSYPPPPPSMHQPPPFEHRWQPPPNEERVVWNRGPPHLHPSIHPADQGPVVPHLMERGAYPPIPPPHLALHPSHPASIPLQPSLHPMPHMFHHQAPMPPPLPVIPPVPPPTVPRHHVPTTGPPLVEPRPENHRESDGAPLTDTTNNTSPQSPSYTPTPANGSSVTIHKKFYKIVNQVGEGTFGQVYKAMNVVNGSFVALKRIRMESERDGFPVTAMREIKLLQSLHHENVVLLHEMMISDSQIYMVFQYMDHDLTGILSQFTFTPANLKSICHQMLTGLAYLHHKGVIHRDIKGSNILINNQGVLKLADFGLARFYHKRRKADYTNRVITLWYRPPELLLGATVYGPEVDMWSAGCIMLELFTKRPTFEGQSEIGQLKIIFEKLGSPTTERWPDVINLPWYELFRPHITDPQPNQLRQLFGDSLSPAGLDLAERLLEYDPSRRITAKEAMQAAYFVTEEPQPERPSKLSEVEGEWHELEWKIFKRKERG